MKQLINQLQRTACTPRDILSGLGDNTPRLVDSINAAASIGTIFYRLTDRAIHFNFLLSQAGSKI